MLTTISLITNCHRTSQNFFKIFKCENFQGLLSYVKSSQATCSSWRLCAALWTMQHCHHTKLSWTALFQNSCVGELKKKRGFTLLGINKSPYKYLLLVEQIQYLFFNTSRIVVYSTFRYDFAASCALLTSTIHGLTCGLPHPPGWLQVKNYLLHREVIRQWLLRYFSSSYACHNTKPGHLP